jgi:hypothetical protein
VNCSIWVWGNVNVCVKSDTSSGCKGAGALGVLTISTADVALNNIDEGIEPLV